jgi:glycosyltransferase involved in cell wall biosynthesis
MKNDYIIPYKKKFFIFFFFIYFLVQITLLKNIPKISIYLPIYNKSKYLMKSIKSIQNQTLKDIEIIAVNDCSTDDSLVILKKIAKNDPRIKIVNNDKNYGLLYTRAMGILKTTGEYIIDVDPDDSLYENNVLEYLYKIANKFRVDVVSFGFIKNHKITFKCTNFDKILKQPKILENAFTKNNYFQDFVLWNKLVKRKLMLKSYEYFKSNIYSDKWNYGEDTIWSVLINKYAKSMICVKKIVYIYNLNKESLMLNQLNIIRIKNIFQYEKFFRQILNKKNEKKYIVGSINLIFNDLKKNNKKKLLLMKPKMDINIKEKLINLLKIYIENYQIPYNIIIDFINIINNY